MDNKVRTLLVEFLTNSTIITSWGITDIKVAETNISFFVNAFKYNGRIVINICNEEHEFTYEIEYTSLYNFKERADISNIISIIDRTIEASDSYYEDIVKWIGKSHA